ncbi:hypothetical protein Taro_013351 [Colocasia esculenta]|uniref:Uncharacterized protein n=1 Tax=Colocasia esculenta TaxID=4460 RepID=A0A843UIH9_COLES|nr:hypothetical protein [Colocasia esculenta]
MVATARCIATTAETGRSCEVPCFCGVFAVSATYCTRCTSASSLVRSYTSRPPSARHLRACPVREVVTVAWDPRPCAPVEEEVQAAGVLESHTLEQRGKWWVFSICVAIRVVVTTSSRMEFPIMLYFHTLLASSYASVLSLIGEISQQGQDARWVEEKGR